MNKDGKDLERPLTASEVEQRCREMAPMRNSLAEYLIDQTCKAIDRLGLIKPSRE